MVQAPPPGFSRLSVALGSPTFGLSAASVWWARETGRQSHRQAVGVVGEERIGAPDQAQVVKERAGAVDRTVKSSDHKFVQSSGEACVRPLVVSYIPGFL
jgi:hypothetical protein